MEKPCVMDIKVGKITYAPDASAEKIAKAKKSYLGTREPFGFSVCGIVVNTDEGMVRLDKKYGKSLSVETMHTVLDNYLGGKNLRAIERAKHFNQKLRDIEAFFEKQTLFHVFGGSLLFIYDQGSSDTTSSHVRLIDFAHSFPANGIVDENYLFGLRNVRNLFETFIETKWFSLNLLNCDDCDLYWNWILIKWSDFYKHDISPVRVAAWRDHVEAKQDAGSFCEAGINDIVKSY